MKFLCLIFQPVRYPGQFFVLLPASVTGMSIGNLRKILLHDIHNLLCDLILKHESTSPEFICGFQCSLLGSKIHYLGQGKSNSLHGSTQVVNIHYLGQIHNLGQNSTIIVQSFIGLDLMVPEIIRGSLKTPLGPLNSKKAWPE